LRNKLSKRSKKIKFNNLHILFRRSAFLYLSSAICGLLVFFAPFAFAEDLKLQELIDEALKKNPELLAFESMVTASAYRVPQAKSLPDPMFMFGYQNEGWRSYTHGDMPDAQWMFSASQMIPFPGKLSLKGEMSERESESLRASHESAKLKIILKVKELFFDLFLMYKQIDLIQDKAMLLKQVEDAAVARYSAGMGSEQEVLMAQTEKYMLLEKEEMLRQKVQSLETMLNTATGRDVNAPLGRPDVLPSASCNYSMDMLIKTAMENSPEIKTRDKMIAAAEAKVRMMQKEYIPDFTLNASYFNRGGHEFDDMWSLTTTINIPIYYKTKQKQAVLEAESSLTVARHELEGTKLMISSGIRDNYSMMKSAERLMELYKNGLIPKTYQDFELSLAGYMIGKLEAITVITRLKSILDYEFLYWGQVAEREKAIARLEAVSGIINKASAVMEKK
jgi:outer membrane protein, heavy metal efflux system